MADLKAQAPLAKLENDEDFGDFGDFTTNDDIKNANFVAPTNKEKNDNAECTCDGFCDSIFGDINSGSLEDLVGTFDEKITKCFSNLQENVESIAPVQVRSQEELLGESQMWWTITGNFGNILPIDWSKSHTRKLHLSALNLQKPKRNIYRPTAESVREEDDDPAVNDLDLDSLALTDVTTVALAEPIKTADEVIREIDDIMADSEAGSCADLDSPDSAIGETRERPPLLTKERLESMSGCELNDTLMDLEMMVKEYSEVLIDELARRDELEYEKELKNQFISLLLTVQNRRRQSSVDKRRRNRLTGTSGEGKYLTTVIPYNEGSKCPENATLQILIKIMRAIDDDSPTVPTLLTDYILKVLCPS